MAKDGVLRNAYIAINGTAFSDHCSSLEISDTADKVDITSFGSGYREFTPGLKDAEISATFFTDGATGSIDDVLRTYYALGAAGTFTLTVRKDAGAASATNQTGTMIARLYNGPAFGGAVGDASEVEVTFANAGTAGLTWGTA